MPNANYLNGGATIVKKQAASPLKGTAGHTVSAQVYASLHERIVTNEFLPGQPISENEIAREYDVSRTPIREAFRRLEQDRLVTRGRGGRGYHVRLFDLDEMDEVYEVRLALEELALRTTGAHLTPEMKGEFTRAWEEWPDEASPSDSLAADEAFHRLLASASGNRPLAEFLDTVTHRIHIIRGIDFTIDARRAASKAEHREIVEAMFAGEIDEASRLLRAHIQRSKSVCERLATEGLAMVYRPRRKEESRLAEGLAQE